MHLHRLRHGLVRAPLHGQADGVVHGPVAGSIDVDQEGDLTVRIDVPAASGPWICAFAGLMNRPGSEMRRVFDPVLNCSSQAGTITGMGVEKCKGGL